MNSTYLKLIIYDNPDLNTIYLQDISVYNPDVPIELPTLQITPPNFSTNYTLFYPTLSLIPINSNVFGWTNTNDPTKLKELQDGLWLIIQSVKPSGLINKTHCHFRITKLKSNLMNEISARLESDNIYCMDKNPWYYEMFKKLQTLETAKYLAENCGKINEANIMYNEILNEYNSSLNYC